jgi:hypothetical protein
MRSAMKIGLRCATVAAIVACASGCVIELRTGTGTGGNFEGGGWSTPPPVVPVRAGVAPPVNNNGGAQRPPPILVGVSPPAQQQPATQVDPHIVPHIGSFGGVTVVKLLPPGNTFGGNSDGRGALKGVLYYVPEGSTKLPDFATLTPQAVTYVDQLNIPLTNFNEGFPGAPNRYEWFGFQYTGTFTTAKAGVYDFHVYSDDGSNIYVDGQKVIDNDGVHLAGLYGKHGQVTLSEGTHSLRVDYYQAYRWTLQLQLFVTPPGGREELWAPTI